MTAEPRNEERRNGRPLKVEWHRAPRLPQVTGGSPPVGGIAHMMTSPGSALSGGALAAGGASLVVSWASQASALGSGAKRALLGLQVALTVVCLGLFVWHARTAWDWL